MRECRLADPPGTAGLAREALGATEPTDLFELDSDDLEELGLKVPGISVGGLGLVV